MEFYKAIKMFFFLVQVSCTLGWPTTHFETKNDLVLNPRAYTTLPRDRGIFPGPETGQFPQVKGQCGLHSLEYQKY